jgi:hypothetical protein
LVAVALLAISPFRVSSNAALFAAGFVAWTLAEYVVHRFVLHGLVLTRHALMPPRTRRSSQFFGKCGFVSHWSILRPEALSLAGG